MQLSPQIITTIVLFFLVQTLLFAQKEPQYTTKEKRKQFYNTLIAKYAPADIQKIWSYDENNEFDQWVDGPAESQLVDDLETVIHETFHGICKSNGDGQDYYINKDLTIYVPYTKVYNSTLLNKVIRKGIQDSIFRYGLYVGGSNELPGGGKTHQVNTHKHNQLTSIVQGIYGLSEEFFAYYYGAYAAYSLFEYYVDKYGKEDEDAWYDFRMLFEGNELAYYEFHFFMANYLVYAKKHEQDVYKGIHGNKAFRVVFTIMENRFKNLIKDYHNKIKSVPNTSSTELYTSMDFSGSDADLLIFLQLFGLKKEDVAKETIVEKNGKQQTSIEWLITKGELEMYRKEYKKNSGKLKKEASNIMVYFAMPAKQRSYILGLMSSEMNEELNKLLLDGCNEQNYESYLK